MDHLDNQIKALLQRTKGDAPKNVHDRIRLTLRQKQLYPRKKRHAFWKVAGSIAVVLLIGFGTAFYTIPSFAQLVNNWFSTSGDIGLKQVSEKQLTNTSPVTVTDKGYTFTILEYYSDAFRTSFTYRITDAKGNPIDYPIPSDYIDVLVNGKKVLIDASDYTRNAPPKPEATIPVKYADPIKAKQVTLQLRIKRIAFDKTVVSGKWNLDLPIAVKQPKQTVQDKKNASFTFPNGEQFVIKGFQHAPSQSIFQYQVVNPPPSLTQLPSFYITNKEGEIVLRHNIGGSGGSDQGMREDKNGNVEVYANPLGDEVGLTLQLKGHYVPNEVNLSTTVTNGTSPVVKWGDNSFQAIGFNHSSLKIVTHLPNSLSMEFSRWVVKQNGKTFRVFSLFRGYAYPPNEKLFPNETPQKREGFLDVKEEGFDPTKPFTLMLVGYNQFEKADWTVPIQ